jgi:hypothetical protein
LIIVCRKGVRRRAGKDGGHGEFVDELAADED